MTVKVEPTATYDETKDSVDSTLNDVVEGNAADDNEKKPTDKTGMVKKAVIGVLLLALIVFVIVDSQTNNFVRDGILSFLEWIEENVVWGVLSFILVYFLATIFFVPGSILTLGAGFVFSAALDNNLGWGVLLGTAAVWVGASTGSIAAFLLGRYLFRDCCVGTITKKYQIFQAIDSALTNNGLKIMILLRLSPIIPFNILNYAAGVTGVQFWHYAVASVAMLPGTILYVFLGASAGSLLEIGGSDEDTEDGDDEEGGTSKAVTYSVIVVGIIFGILAVGVTSYYAKQELNKVLENGDGKGEGSSDISSDDEEDEEQPADESNERYQ